MGSATDRQKIRNYEWLLRVHLGLDPQQVEAMKPKAREEAIAQAMRGLAGRVLEERRQTDLVLGGGVTVILAGREYEIKPLTIRQDRAWRKKAGEVAGRLIGSIMALRQPAEGGEDPSIDQEAMLAKAMPILFGEGLEDMIDLLFLYSPELAAERESLEPRCSSAELTRAAMEAFKLAFPFVLEIGRGMLEMMDMAKAAGIQI